MPCEHLAAVRCFYIPQQVFDSRLVERLCLYARSVELLRACLSGMFPRIRFQKSIQHDLFLFRGDADRCAIAIVAEDKAAL
jgi:hypothetical protein